MQPVKLFLCGDVMTGRGIDQILRHSCDPRIYEGYVKDARDYVRLAERASGAVPRGVGDAYIWGDARAAASRLGFLVHGCTLKMARVAGQTKRGRFPCPVPKRR
jgi:poly-gamma-glutamate capsule biosynthesis protein CapA/YwtB (metallophosphatase superfamily)